MEVEKKTVPRAKATRIISEVIRQDTADLMPQIVSFGILYFQVLIGVSPVSDLSREQSPALFVTLCFLGSKYIVQQPVFGGIKLGRLHIDQPNRSLNRLAASTSFFSFA